MENNSFDSIRARFQADVEDYNRGKGQMFNPLLRGACMSELLRACGGVEEHRRLVLMALVYKTQTIRFTEADWYALGKFVDPKLQGKHTYVRDGLREDCAAIIEHELERQEREERILAELGEWS